METHKEFTRLSVQECLALLEVPASPDESKGAVHTFVSQQPAWWPGKDLPWAQYINNEERPRKFGPGAFGGHVYAQAPLAAARVVEKEDEKVPSGKKRGIHSIQGVFTNPGKVDRPFVYEVSHVASSRAFSTRLVNARQPLKPSAKPDGPFEVTEASRPLSEVCFSCLVTFKRPLQGPHDLQVSPSPQERYAATLSQRAPDQWTASAQADVDWVKDLFPNFGHGSFPMVDMYQVDMKGFNADKPVPEKRELILYRLNKPLPKAEVNAHVVVHTYVADRNGFIMLGNHLGYGYNLGAVASLSFGFYINTNAEEAVMEGDGWWLAEVHWPRISAGRGLMVVQIWNPQGRLIASGYQDGLILPGREEAEEGPKL